MLRRDVRSNKHSFITLREKMHVEFLEITASHTELSSHEMFGLPNYAYSKLQQRLNTIKQRE